MQPLLKEGQHLRQLVVRVHVVHGAAALLQQPDDVLVLDLLVHLELLESGAQRLEKGAEVAVVGEVGLRQLHGRGGQGWMVVTSRAYIVGGKKNNNKTTENNNSKNNNNTALL